MFLSALCVSCTARSIARRGARMTNKSFARETPVYKRFRRSINPWAEERQSTTALYSQPCDLWTVIAHAGRRLARTSDFVYWMDFLLKVTVVTFVSMDVTTPRSPLKTSLV